ESPKFYSNNSGVKELASSREVYEMDAAGKYLIPRYRYEFTYDAQNRVVEKRISQWNAWDRQWNSLQKLNYTYESETLTIELSYWNSEKESFNEVSEKAVYGVSDGRYTFYAGYERKSASDEWKLITHYPTDAPALFPDFQNDYFIAEVGK
ncbi:MAG: DUF3836 domain-containing protein, partial [Tannerella sp.]|nr:DUF3836 domain-containing protein [Tannerella sp.]